MTRILPGVYVSLYDYSTLPEGETNLTVGYVLKANRGKVNEAVLCTSPTDFLAKYTFNGYPSITDDTTFWSILQVLRQTNKVYVVRCSKDATLGGLTIKKETEVGTITATTKAVANTNGGTITVTGDVTASVPADTIVRVFGKKDIEGRYKVKSSSTSSGSTVITLEIAGATDKDFTNMEKNYVATEGDNVKLIKVAAPATSQTAITNPEDYEFGADDLFLITGVDEGAYNNDIAITITSWSESPDLLTEEDVFTIDVWNAVTGNKLETWMCNRQEGGKLFDGSPSFIEEVLKSSNYIRAYNNKAIAGTVLPGNCTKARLGGGSNGSEVDENDMVGALNVFRDKTVSVSILGNGSQETPLFQSTMINIADYRKDCVAFLNDRVADEKNPYPSVKAENIVNYKKGDLASTKWCATMYAPHVNYPDSFNSRTIKIGADATAIAGWLSVIINQGFPFAYAGPTYGLVDGVTCDWKIGDTSAEAELLNDASINYIAYDSKVGRYYMQCQNTLQVANSALRNLGAVLNVLDMKETFATYFKEYLQRPITASLRSEILLRGRNYMEQTLSQGRVTAYDFADVSTDTDIADNTLRYVLTVALTPYAQKIYLIMNIVNQAFDFSILQG